MKQYEIWWAKLPEPVGRRPVLLLSRDSAYEYLNRILVAEITTTVRRIPQELSLGPREGLPKRCVANLDNMHSVHKSVLQQRAGTVARSRLWEIKQAVGYTLGWPELTLPSGAE
jgi:mRNA interferase MazF